MKSKRWFYKAGIFFLATISVFVYEYGIFLLGMFPSI